MKVTETEANLLVGLKSSRGSSHNDRGRLHGVIAWELEDAVIDAAFVGRVVKDVAHEKKVSMEKVGFQWPSNRTGCWILFELGVLLLETADGYRLCHCASAGRRYEGQEPVLEMNAHSIVAMMHIMMRWLCCDDARVL